mmetsp:Transcript_19784/g.42699  ORF Transcript_19784/g.42699 Transcript_19784/m.42699 type:complete len:295 (-) Transcript_19784:2110-2994(-)
MKGPGRARGKEGGGGGGFVAFGPSSSAVALLLRLSLHAGLRLEDQLGGGLHAERLLLVERAAHLWQEGVVLELGDAEGREAGTRDTADELAQRVGRVVGDEVGVDEDGGARHVGAVGEVLGDTAHGERALLHLLGHVGGVRSVALWVECRLKGHVRGDAGEQERAPPLVDGEGVDTLEVVLRGQVAKERGVERLLAVLDVGEHAHVRARVHDAVLGDLERAARIAQAEVAHLLRDDLVHAVLAALDLLRLLANLRHLLLDGGLHGLDLLVQLLQARHLLHKRLGRLVDLAHRIA